MLANRLLCVFTISLSLLTAITNLSGQDIWTLQKCINTAWENNLNIDNADLSVKAAEVRNRQAKEARYPSLNAGTGLNLNFGRSVDPTSNTFVAENFLSNNYSVNSGVLLFNGFQLKNNYLQSSVDKEAAIKDQKQLERDIALSVANSYLNVLFAKENLRIAQNNLKQSNQQLDQISKLIKAGTRAINESLDAEALIANDERLLVIAKNNLDIAFLQLKQTMLLDESNLIEVISPEEISIDSDTALLTLSEVYTSALNVQQSIRASELRAKSASIGIDIAKSQLYPRITLGGSLGTNYSNKGIQLTGYQPYTVEQDIIFNGAQTTIGILQEIPTYKKKSYSNQVSDNLSYGFGLNVSIPIYNNYTTKASIKNAELNSEQQNNNLEIAKQNLKTTVQQSLADARAAKSAYAASQKSLDTQQKLFDFTQKKFDAGTANAFELSNQRVRLDNANLNLLISKYDYFFKTKVIDFYMGKPIKI